MSSIFLSGQEKLCDLHVCNSRLLSVLPPPRNVVPEVTSNPRWRHLDVFGRSLILECELLRLRCPSHGVRTQAVPFARPGARITRQFENLIAWCAASMEWTAASVLCRVAWRTVANVVERVVPSSTELSELDRAGSHRRGRDLLETRTQVPDLGHRPRFRQGHLGGQGPHRSHTRSVLRRSRRNQDRCHQVGLDENGTSRPPHPERTRRWEVGDDTDEVSDDHLPRGNQNPNAPPELA